MDYVKIIQLLKEDNNLEAETNEIYQLLKTEIFAGNLPLNLNDIELKQAESTYFLNVNTHVFTFTCNSNSADIQIVSANFELGDTIEILNNLNKNREIVQKKLIEFIK